MSLLAMLPTAGSGNTGRVTDSAGISSSYWPAVTKLLGFRFFLGFNVGIPDTKL